MTAAPTTRSAATDDRRRSEIQSLRALAVGVVVIYHLFPGILKGGFVGVDVFFAISGFLITAHLLREALGSGRVSLPRFWARRARRLLPASLVVIAASAIATLVWVPQAQWVQFFREFGASALYIENWALAGDAVDYLAADNIASPVQHYWSLSTEEQFYLVWPILIVVGLWIAARRGTPEARRRAIGGVLVVIVLASLVWSVWRTQTAPSEAYFSTFTRAWEFGLGGLLALLPVATAAPRFRAIVSWVGVALILVACFTFTGATPFPGIAASLPVLGTLAVMWAGSPRVAWSPSALTDIRPIQWLGDVSYSVYLWHWPLIVILPFALGSDIGWPHKLAILAATLVLAWLSKRFVEDPARSARVLTSRKPRWTFVGVLASMALVVGVSAGVGGAITAREQAIEDHAQQEIDAGAVCFGAPAALEPAGACDPVEPDDIVPSQATFSSERPAIYDDACRAREGDGTVKMCAFGPDDTGRSVALVGDSHTAQWFPTLEQLATAEGFRLYVFFKSGCPSTDGELFGMYDEVLSSCLEWNRNVVDEVAKIPDLDAVVTSATTGYAVPDEAAEQAWIDGYRARLEQLTALGAEVLVIRDTPHLNDAALECLQSSPLSAIQECGRERARSFSKPDLQVAAAETVPGATITGFTDVLCPVDWCPGVIGGVIAYRDTSSHMTVLFARTMAPVLWEKLEPLLPAA